MTFIIQYVKAQEYKKPASINSYKAAGDDDGHCQPRYDSPKNTAAVAQKGAERYNLLENNTLVAQHTTRIVQNKNELHLN